MKLCKMLQEHTRIFVYWGEVRHLIAQGRAETIFTHYTELPWIFLDFTRIGSRMLVLGAFKGDVGRSTGVDDVNVRFQP